MKKILSALAGISLMVAPAASASAMRPASAVPVMSASTYVVQDDEDDSDDDELFILGVMAGVIVIVALAIFNSDDNSDEFVGPPISGA